VRPLPRPQVRPDSASGLLPHDVLLHERLQPSGMAETEGALSAGRIKDGAGGVVAVNVATNVETGTATTETGNYAILHLVPGTYRVKIEMPGFRRFVRENIIVNVDSIARVDVQLEVGETSSEITVAGAAPLLQADKVELSTVLSEKQVQELPTLGRNMSRLVQILPGALPATGQLQYHVENMVEDYRVGVNGQIWGNNNRAD
jgi:Carboxypeptidase regulatory-like domain